MAIFIIIGILGFLASAWMSFEILLHAQSAIHEIEGFVMISISAICVLITCVAWGFDNISQYLKVAFARDIKIDKIKNDYDMSCEEKEAEVARLMRQQGVKDFRND